MVTTPDSYDVSQFVSVPPDDPVKHITRRSAFLSSAGNSMRATTASIGTGQSLPVIFQYNSSWSEKYVSAPAALYKISYVWTPLMVLSGSPIFRVRVSPEVVLVNGYASTEKSENVRTNFFPSLFVYIVG